MSSIEIKKQNYLPKVSIIIPVYNGSNYVSQAIDSALSQTYKNIEIIVVNDGSNDEDKTNKECLKYENRIRYFNKKNSGISSALNYGLDNMTGDYFSWLSHDDLYNKDKIRNQVEKLLEFDFSEDIMIVSNSDLINSKGEIIRKGRNYSTNQLKSEKLFKAIHKKNLNGCGLLIHKNQLLKIGGFNEDFRYIQDLLAWSLLSLNDIMCIYDSTNLISTRIHEQQQTIKIANLYSTEVKKYINLIISNNNLKVIHYESIVEYAIKRNLWDYIKSLMKNGQIKVSGLFKLKIPFIMVRGYFNRFIKAMYWKIKRR